MPDEGKVKNADTRLGVSEIVPGSALFFFKKERKRRQVHDGWARTFKGLPGLTC